MGINQLKKDIFNLNADIINLQYLVNKNFRKCEKCKITNLLELRAELNIKRKQMSDLRQELFIKEVFKK